MPTEGRLNRNDADGARNSFRGNVDLRIGFRVFRWVVLKHESVLGPDDMGKRVNAGGKWTLPRMNSALLPLQLHGSGQSL